MLSPSLKYSVILALASFVAGVSPAQAGLYGFNSANPMTKEEKVLDMKYLPMQIRNYRGDLRATLQMLIDYAKENHPDFKIITHEGQELLHRSSWETARDGYNLARQKKGSLEDVDFLQHTNKQQLTPKQDTPEYKYLHSVDAVAINGLYCGKGQEQKITKDQKLGLISIDYCPSSDEVDRAIVRSFLDKKILYTFSDRTKAFNNIVHQPMINDSAKNILEVSDASNILILTDDRHYPSRISMVQDILNSNYDIVIIKPLFQNTERFNEDEIRSMQYKKNGARRLLIAEMNVTEASPQDYFWDLRWKVGFPSWLVRKSFVDEKSIITEYWNETWQKIIAKHFKDIIITGFDGVFFTGLQNHFYFEHLTPLE